MKIDNEGAMKLLEAMVKDSADSFEGGVRRYIESDKALKRAKRALQAAVRSCVIALDEKRNAVRVITEEYSFLNNEETIKPGFDGAYVVSKLIVKVVENLEDMEFADLLADLSKEEKESKT